MANYRSVPPVIRWGTNLANAVYFPFPLDSVFSGPGSRDGSEYLQYWSGVEDAWRATDCVLLGTHRWLSPSDTLFYPRCTGWDGTLGIRAALEYLQAKNTFSWHPDGRNLLRLPKLNSAGAATLSGFGGWSPVSDAGTTGVTNAFDGVETAWKLAGTNPTGGALTIYLMQYVPAIPGETFTLSADYKVSGLAGGADARVRLDAYDSTPTFLASAASDGTGTSTTYARQNTTAALTTPANTAYVRCAVMLRLPGGVGATGSAWFKNVLLRRDTTDTTFIDNPSIDGCYLVEPTDFSPANESDGSRQLVMKIRNPTTPFDGY